MPDTTAITPPLPSVTDLGRRLAALDIAFYREDENQARSKHDINSFQRTERAMDIIDDQRRALRDLIASMPAQTLADAAVQIECAAYIATNLHADQADQYAEERLGGLHQKLETICLSVLPIVAAEAGLDIEAMDWTDHCRLRAQRFQGLENVA